MHHARHKTVGTFLLALLMTGCAKVRLQTVDEFSAEMYKSAQQSLRKDCQTKSSSGERIDCTRQANQPYDQYQEQRQNAQGAGGKAGDAKLEKTLCYTRQETGELVCAN